MISFINLCDIIFLIGDDYMRKYYNDELYMDIVNDILNHNEFQNLKKYKHHGMNRLTHATNVSYRSYRIIKFLRLDYEAAARGGLLHDFFFVNNQEIKLSKRIQVLFKHPIYAYDNSKKYFKISKVEKNIIISHMFPFGLSAPIYPESLIVNLVDDILSVYERVYWVLKKTI